MDVDALIMPLPRITNPALTKTEVMALDIADLVVVLHRPPLVMGIMSVEKLMA